MPLENARSAPGSVVGYFRFGGTSRPQLADRGRLRFEDMSRTTREAAHSASAMDYGLIPLSGEAREMRHDPKVRAAHLGEAAA